MKKNYAVMFILFILLSFSGVAYAEEPQGATQQPTVENSEMQKAISERFKGLFSSIGNTELTQIQTQALPPFVGDRFARTELYFGSAKPDGSVVTIEQFQRFLDREITPRFPDGLTLLVGLGQFRGSNGVIVRERSMLLILLYPESATATSSRKIEEIRDLYKRAFQQESVLRSDRCCELVGF